MALALSCGASPGSSHKQTEYHMSYNTLVAKCRLVDSLFFFCCPSVYSGHQSILIPPLELESSLPLWLSTLSQYKIRDTFCSYSVMELCTKGLGTQTEILKVRLGLYSQISQGLQGFLVIGFLFYCVLCYFCSNDDNNTLTIVNSLVVSVSLAKMS